MSKYGNQIVHCEIDGVAYRFKSKAEYRYACYLQFLKANGDIISWQYEPEAFRWLNQKGNWVVYRPDFKVIEKVGVTPEGLIEARRTWYEVKGYYDTRSRAKIKGFNTKFPTEKLVLIDSPWFKKNSPKLKGLVPGWTSFDENPNQERHLVKISRDL